MSNCPKCETKRIDDDKYIVGTLVIGSMITCTKCDYKICLRERCTHGAEYHKEGACWFITQPIFENDNTDEKYCICNEQDNIRLYKTKGFMVKTPNDYMITKKCDTCGDEVTLLANVTTCNRCKDRPENYQPLNPTEFVRATVHLKRPNQQRS